LKIPESFLATMGIALETLTPGDLRAEIHAPGTVSAARAAGTIVRLNKRLGDPVESGEILGRVESRDAAAMAADRTTAESKVKLARSNLEREQSLYEQKVTPRQDFETARDQLVAAEAEASRAAAAATAAGVASDSRSLSIVTPIAGRITSTNVVLGAYVEPGMELFRVADPRFVLIESSVTSEDARRVNVGDPSRVVTNAGSSLEAEVVSVTPTVNEQTRSATVTLKLMSDRGAPSPGEFVQTFIMPKTAHGNGLVVPDEAVQIVNGRDVLFVRRSDLFVVAPVVIGARSGGQALILSGITAGEHIATRNAFLLKAELGKGAEDEE
jgi:cobalt-zinc-cadmium efflux system membrane fusion protein